MNYGYEKRSPDFKFDYSKINCKFENIVESSNCDTLLSKNGYLFHKI